VAGHEDQAEEVVGQVAVSDPVSDPVDVQFGDLGS
jgi:hypothetical protein